MKKKILLISLWNSIHNEKWISNFSNTNFKFCIFPSNISKHRKFQFISKKNVDYFFFKIFLNNEINFLLNKLFFYFFKEKWQLFSLKICLFFFKPDIVHSLEMQRAGILFSKLRKNHYQTTWICTNWGSDLYLFSQLKHYSKDLSDLLKSIDYYSAECNRDYEIAKNLGFKGSLLPCIPNGGGFDIETIKSLRNKYKFKDRKLILIKGYQSIVGRALDILKVIENIHDKIKDYKIVFYSSSESVVINAELIKNKYDLDIVTIPENEIIEYDEMIKLFSKSLIYLGHSLSDGISTSLLEAMALGAYPIQTNTSCASEWIDKDCGFISNLYDLKQIELKIIEIINDENIFYNAFHKNINTIEQRANKKNISKIAINYYQNI